MSSRYYCVKIEVENIEDVDVVKNTALMYDAYVDGMFDELTIEDTAENVKKRYITSLSENEKIKLAELVESHKNSDDVISVIINQNTITLNLYVDDTFDWAADKWFEFLVLMAELTTDINFKIRFEVNVENIFFNSFGGGEYKNGIILFCGTTFWGGCEIELHGTQYLCNEYDSPENFPTFYEAGAIIDGKYVQFEKYDIPSIKDCKICFSATGYEEILTKIINQNGGIVRSCVSGKTDYLICDAEDGYETSKLIKAKELNQAGKNIKIVTACEFFETLCFKNKSHDKKTVDDSKNKNIVGDIEKTKKKLSDVFE